jgi:hypothetical protein
MRLNWPSMWARGRLLPSRAQQRNESMPNSVACGRFARRGPCPLQCAATSHASQDRASTQQLPVFPVFGGGVRGRQRIQRVRRHIQHTAFRRILKASARISTMRAPNPSLEAVEMRILSTWPSSVIEMSASLPTSLPSARTGVPSSRTASSTISASTFPVSGSSSSLRSRPAQRTAQIIRFSRSLGLYSPSILAARPRGRGSRGRSPR